MKQSEGIYVPKKVIMWMIFASVFINILFLLMGMVIGKDDKLWRSDPTQTPLTQSEAVPTEDPDQQALNVELSLYERDENAGPPKPADVSYLEDSSWQALQDQSNQATDTAQENSASPSPAENQPEPEVKAVPQPQPETRREPEPVRPSDPPITSGGAYFIQVMASKDPSKVKQMEEQLTKMGYRVFFENQGDMTKICVGNFANESEANHGKSVIDRAFKLNSWVRKN